MNDQEIEQGIQARGLALNFSQALDAIKDMGPVRRTSWADPSEYVMLLDYPPTIDLPYQLRPSKPTHDGEQGREELLTFFTARIRPHLFKHSAATGKCEYWTPSTEDLLADDWYIEDTMKFINIMKGGAA